MINNSLIFYLSSFLIIVFCLTALFAKNIINSLLASIIVFFVAGLFFYMLGSEYNAIIQIAIYGFAVPIIVGLSIMFTTGKCESKKNYSFVFVLTTFALAFLLFFSDTIIFSITNIPDTFHITELPQFNSYDVISAFAKGIFINYVFAFELMSLLLVIVIAGISMFKKNKRNGA